MFVYTRRKGFKKRCDKPKALFHGCMPDFPKLFFNTVLEKIQKNFNKIFKLNPKGLKPGLRPVPKGPSGSRGQKRLIKSERL